MDRLVLKQNLEFVRPEVGWHMVDELVIDGASVVVNVDLGVCLLMGGSIFGSSHIAVHEILHAKGMPKKNALESVAKKFLGIPVEKAGGMLSLLEELRVERLVKEKGYTMPPDRFSGNRKIKNLLFASIAEIWSLKVPVKHLLRKRAKRLADVVTSYKELPTTPGDVAEWMADALPKAWGAVQPMMWEKVIIFVTNVFFKLLNFLRWLIYWLKTKFWWLWDKLFKNESANLGQEEPKERPRFRPAINPYDPLEKTALRQKFLEEELQQTIKKRAKKRTACTVLHKAAQAVLRSNTYAEFMLLLPPAHSTCPIGAGSTAIPTYITNALQVGLKNKERCYGRSGRRLVVSRLLSCSPPFAKDVLRTQKNLILLDFSSSMKEFLAPMLEVVAELAANTDFDVMAYSATIDRFLLHFIYSDKHFSHVAHYYGGNADCAAFYVAKYVQADYDKVIIIGDMRFFGPAPMDTGLLYNRSVNELIELVSGGRAVVLAPHPPKSEEILQILENRLHIFEDDRELKEKLELVIRST